MGLLNGCDLLGESPGSGAGCGVSLTCLLISALSLLSSLWDLGLGPTALSLTLFTGEGGTTYLEGCREEEHEKVSVKCYILSTQQYFYKNNKNYPCLGPSCILN